MILGTFIRNRRQLIALSLCHSILGCPHMFPPASNNLIVIEINMDIYAKRWGKLFHCYQALLCTCSGPQSPMVLCIWHTKSCIPLHSTKSFELIWAPPSTQLEPCISVCPTERYQSVVIWKQMLQFCIFKFNWPVYDFCIIGHHCIYPRIVYLVSSQFLTTSF